MAMVTLALELPSLDLSPGEPSQEEGVCGMPRKEVSVPEWAGWDPARVLSLVRGPAAGSGWQ